MATSPRRPSALRRRPSAPVSAILSLLALAAIAGGCTAESRAPARRLLETITKANKRLVGASRGFSDSVVARLEDKASNDDLAGATEKLVRAIDDLREESLEWIVPASPQAESLVATYRSNLERRRAIVEEYGGKIHDTIANSVVPIQEKRKKARAIYEEMLKKADGEVAAMRDAQRRYAGSMGIFAYE